MTMRALRREVAERAGDAEQRTPDQILHHVILSAARRNEARLPGVTAVARGLSITVADTETRPGDRVLAALLHRLAHGYNDATGQPDQGVHGVSFAWTGSLLGLTVAPDPGRPDEGYSITTLSPAAVDFYADLIDDLDALAVR